MRQYAYNYLQVSKVIMNRMRSSLSVMVMRQYEIKLRIG